MPELTIKPTFIKQLTGDPETENYPRPVAEFFTYVHPAHPGDPTLHHHISELSDELRLDSNDSSFLDYVSGLSALPDYRPWAMNYAGHQFGNWAGQLGDGRAINIAELEGKTQFWTVQLKGAGLTPYSRGADGKAVLRSSIREYLCAEAMHHLGIPTTRSLALVTTGDKVLRDVLNDGHPAHEPGAIVTRAAESFIRFGNFELFASRGDKERLQELLDFTITTHFPNLTNCSDNVYLALYEEVVNRTIELMVEWERVGFVHGVMNTDNMSILGLTIDYGPYGWLDAFDPDWTPNTTDNQFRRYRFGNQSDIAYWNLRQLGRALALAIGDADSVQTTLHKYHERFATDRETMYRNKLGLETTQDTDAELIASVLTLLEEQPLDMTRFWRHLSQFDETSPGNHLSLITDDAYTVVSETDKTKWLDWLDTYAARLRTEAISQSERAALMNKVNPKYVFRNYIASQVIEAAENDDYTLFRTVYELLKHPYDEQTEHEIWFQKQPAWARDRIGCSQLSCSS